METKNGWMNSYLCQCWTLEVSYEKCESNFMKGKHADWSTDLGDSWVMDCTYTVLGDLM